MWVRHKQNCDFRISVNEATVEIGKAKERLNILDFLWYQALTKAFTTAPVLTHWILDTQITVETDASDYTLTTVLSIMTPDGELHPIAFHSQTFSTPELNYDLHNKELLAIFEAFKRW